MEEPEFEAVQRQTGAIVGIYEASSDSDCNVHIDVNTTTFALALASFRIVTLMAASAQAPTKAQS